MLAAILVIGVNAGYTATTIDEARLTEQVDLDEAEREPTAFERFADDLFAGTPLEVDENSRRNEALSRWFDEQVDQGVMASIVLAEALAVWTFRNRAWLDPWFVPAVKALAYVLVGVSFAATLWRPYRMWRASR